MAETWRKRRKEVQIDLTELETPVCAPLLVRRFDAHGRAGHSTRLLQGAHFRASAGQRLTYEFQGQYVVDPHQETIHNFPFPIAG
jgi:hypothetical protein